MSTRAGLPALSLSLLTLSCGALGGLYLADGPAFEPVPEVPEGKALVYVYRLPKAQGGATAFKLHLSRLEPITTPEELRAAAREATWIGEGVEEEEMAFWAMWEGREDSPTLPQDHHLFSALESGGSLYWLRDLDGIRLDRWVAGLEDDDLPTVVRLPKSGAYQPYFLDPGEYFFFSESFRDGGTYLPAPTRPRWLLQGQIRQVATGPPGFLRVEWAGSNVNLMGGRTLGSQLGGGRVEAVPPEVGLAEIRECKLAGDSGS